MARPPVALAEAQFHLFAIADDVLVRYDVSGAITRFRILI